MVQKKKKGLLQGSHTRTVFLHSEPSVTWISIKQIAINRPTHPAHLKKWPPRTDSTRMREHAVTIRHPKALTPATEDAPLQPARQLLKNVSQLFVHKNFNLGNTLHCTFVGACNVAHTNTHNDDTCASLTLVGPTGHTKTSFSGSSSRQILRP